MDFFGIIFTVIFCALVLLIGMYYIAQYPAQILGTLAAAGIIAWIFWPRQGEETKPTNEWE